MKLTIIALSALFAAAMAQDTFHCPDGWELHEAHGNCNCFLFGASERVTREDADILCAFHDGAWVAEPSHPGKKPKLWVIMTRLIIIIIVLQD